MSLLSQSAIYLSAAVVAVALFSRLGFGSILGYLTAGSLLDPGFSGWSTMSRIFCIFPNSALCCYFS